MNPLSKIVQDCSHALAQSTLKDQLLPLWNQVAWQVHTRDNGGMGAELDRSGAEVITLYPVLASRSRPHHIVLRQFGDLMLRRSGERGEAIWRNKLDAPTLEQVALVQAKLDDAELRARCKTYRDVLDSYPDKGGSVDRLVFINLTNALLANNIPYTDSEGVDIYTWGPTTTYAKREVYHSLVPLMSAYCPGDVFEHYGSALAALLLDELKSVGDRSVAYALRSIIQRIAIMASPS